MIDASPGGVTVAGLSKGRTTSDESFLSVMEFAASERQTVFGSILRSTERITAVVAVSAYLAIVACFLVLRGRIRINPLGFVRRLLAKMRPPFKADILQVTHEKGHCYMAPLGNKLISDANGRSRLVLFEDGKALPHPHSIHADIRELGNGRYSHWGDALYFSSSDNTDPFTNGRRYSVREV